MIERADLLARRLDEPAAILLDVVAQEPPKGDRRGEIVVDSPHPVRTERLPPAAVADPVGVGALDGGSCCLRRRQRVGIEHDLARRVGPEQRVAALEAGQVDIGKGDGVAGPRLAVRRPVGQVGQGSA